MGDKYLARLPITPQQGMPYGYGTALGGMGASQSYPPPSFPYGQGGTCWPGQGQLGAGLLGPSGLPSQLDQPETMRACGQDCRGAGSAGQAPASTGQQGRGKAGPTRAPTQVGNASSMSAQTAPGQASRRHSGSLRDASTFNSSRNSLSHFGVSRLAVSDSASLRDTREEKDEYLMRLLRGAQPPVARASPARAGSLQLETSGSDASNTKRPGTGSTERDRSSGTDKEGVGNQSPPIFAPSRPALVDQSSLTWGGTHGFFGSHAPAQHHSTMATQLKAKLGERAYSDMRLLILKQQDTFTQQVWEVHRMAKRQQHLSAACERPDQMQAEVHRLKAEQLQSNKDASACHEKQRADDQQHRQQEAQATRTIDSSSAAYAAAPSLVKPTGNGVSRPGSAGIVDAQRYPQGIQGAIDANRVADPLALLGNPWALQAGLMGAVPPPPFFPGSLTPVAGMYRQAFGSQPYAFPGAGLDPMAAWYAQHYGSVGGNASLHQAPFVAGDGAPSIQDEQLRSQSGAQAATPPARWWQDPAAVFGPAAVPEVVARAHLALQESAKQNEATSKDSSFRSKEVRQHGPPKKRMRSTPRSVERSGQTAEPDQHLACSSGWGKGNGSRAMAALSHGASLNPMESEGSAFRKLPQKPRSKLQQAGVRPAESATSENSKSSIDRGQNRGGRAVSSGAPPAALTSAAGILLSFSGV